ncbi:hypothetical protein CPB86DRAFT_782479 [Serendipita vermifera]|nr:hypothetical protein CPB86DRAFT_782479 [Serendipita vermifera]
MSTSSSHTTVSIPGGIPDNTDIVLSSIFIPIFLFIAFFLHARIFKAYGKKFIWSGLCVSYCIARVVALSLRIASIKKPTNTALGIVAQIMIAAGVAILFVVNLQMSRRFYGQLHPHHAVPVQRFITGCIIAVVPVLAAVITTVVQSYTTKNAHVLSVGRTIRLVVSCIFTILPFIPIVIVSLVLVLKATSPGGLSAPQVLSEDLELDAQNAEGQSGRPSSSERPATGDNATVVGNDSASALAADDNTLSGAYEKKKNPSEQSVVVHTSRAGEPETGFGPVPVTRKDILENAAVIVIPAILLTFEQGIRTAQAFYVPKLGHATPWYMTKPAFWICIFGFEVIAASIFGLAVLPRRFSHLRVITI